jgi:hypothetical protein
VALETHKNDIMREYPDFAKKKFLYHLSRSDYEKEWGKDYTKPGIRRPHSGRFFRFMPKIGPFKGLAFNNPYGADRRLIFQKHQCHGGPISQFAA